MLSETINIHCLSFRSRDNKKDKSLALVSFPAVGALEYCKEKTRDPLTHRIVWINNATNYERVFRAAKEIFVLAFHYFSITGIKRLLGIHYRL